MKKRNVAVFLFAGSIVCNVFAQHNNASPKKETDELRIDLNPVVVTGTGSHKRLKSTAVPVNVVTANDIKKAGITDFQQAMNTLLPSFSFSANAMGSYLMMNGLSNKYVLILINGKKVIGDTDNNIDLSRIDVTRIRRIEVLKGAGSSLYGSDAIAGVINIITDQPAETISFLANTRYEEYGQYSNAVNASANIGILGTHTSYTRQESDGWQLNKYTENDKRTNKKAIDAFNSNIVNQRFTFKPSQMLSFYAEGGYYDRDTKREIKTKEIEGHDYNLYYEGFNLGIGGKLFLNKRDVIQLDINNNNYDMGYKYILPTSKYALGEKILVKRQHYYNGNLKGGFSFTNNTRTIIGLDYITETLERKAAYVDDHTYTLAAYAQEEITINRFQAIAGMRYNYHSNAGSHVTPNISLMYQLPYFNFRGQYSTGFRAPGLNELYYYNYKGGTLSVGNKNLKVEKSRYGSFNVEYYNAHINVGVTGYINRLSNMINGRVTRMSDLTTEEQQAIIAEATEIIGETEAKEIKKIKRFVNDEKALVKGIEVNANSNIGYGFSLGGSYVYTHARTKDVESSWIPIIRSLKHAATVTANYAHSWKDYTLNINLNGRIQSKRFHIASGKDESAAGYGQWDLSTRHIISFDHFTLEPGIGINNIFDRKDRHPYGANYSHLSPGRTVFICLALRFNK